MYFPIDLFCVRIYRILRLVTQVCQIMSLISIVITLFLSFDFIKTNTINKQCKVISECDSNQICLQGYCHCDQGLINKNLDPKYEFIASSRTKNLRLNILKISDHWVLLYW